MVIECVDNISRYAIIRACSIVIPRSSDLRWRKINPLSWRFVVAMAMWGGNRDCAEHRQIKEAQAYVW